MATAIIGAGSTGAAVVRHLVTGGEPVVLPAKDKSQAEAACRIEMPGGDLHHFGLNGRLLDLDEAQAPIATEVTA